MRTLIVEDDPLFIKLVSALLDRKARPLDATITPLTGLDYLRSNRYDLLITDLMMDGMSGADLIRIALAEGLVAKERILVITGERNGSPLSWIRGQGIRILHKPFTSSEFRAMIATLPEL